MTPEIRQELLRLLSAQSDGELRDEQHARLNELLDADADNRRLYLEYTDLHARLLTHPSLGGPALPAPESVNHYSPLTIHRSPRPGNTSATRSSPRRRWSRRCWCRRSSGRGRSAR